MAATRQRLDRWTLAYVVESMSLEVQEDERDAEPDHFTRRRINASVPGRTHLARRELVLPFSGRMPDATEGQLWDGQRAAGVR